MLIDFYLTYNIIFKNSMWINIHCFSGSCCFSALPQIRLSSPLLRFYPFPSIQRWIAFSHGNWRTLNEWLKYKFCEYLKSHKNLFASFFLRCSSYAGKQISCCWNWPLIFSSYHFWLPDLLFYPPPYSSLQPTPQGPTCQPTPLPSPSA